MNVFPPPNYGGPYRWKLPRVRPGLVADAFRLTTAKLPGMGGHNVGRGLAPHLDLTNGRFGPV